MLGPLHAIETDRAAPPQTRHCDWPVSFVGTQACKRSFQRARMRVQKRISEGKAGETMHKGRLVSLKADDLEQSTGSKVAHNNDFTSEFK